MGKLLETMTQSSTFVAAAFTKLTFHIKPDVEVLEVHLNASGDTVFVGSDHSYDAYSLSEIKSIIPPKQGPHTKLQRQFMNLLMKNHEYKWNKERSTSAAGVVMERSDGDFWFFGIDGEIMHNPQALLSITL